MRPRILGFGVILIFVDCRPLLAEAPVTYHNALQRKPFQAIADTVIYKPHDMDDQSTEKSIRIVLPNHSVLVSLNLMQHRSKDRPLGNLLGIDSIAYIWRCIRANMNNAARIFLQPRRGEDVLAGPGIADRRLDRNL